MKLTCLKALIIFMFLFYAMTAIADVQMHPVLDNRVDPEDSPTFVDLILSGGNIMSASSINLKPSGDNDDFLSFLTINNSPYMNITGLDFWHITSDGNAPAIRLFQDISHHLTFGWDGDETGLFGSTHNVVIRSFGNNGNITLSPHGSGEVNIDSYLNMNDNPITNVGYLSFDLDAVVPNEEGNVGWNTEDGTFDVHMPGGTVTLQVGQEMLIRSRNDSGSDMTDGQLVFISGASGNKPQLTLAKADTEATSAKTIGMLTEDIDNNSNGYINTFGFVRDIKTDVDADSTALSEGDMLYLSENVAGGFTKTKPISPDHLVCIGYVIKAHATEGIIFIRVQNGFEVDELHDVLISSVADNELLVWDSASSIWQNQTPTEAGLDDRYYTQDKVNEIVAGNTFDFFLNDTLSGIGSPEYFTMDATETGEAESTFADTITNDDFLIDSWATSTSEPTFSALVSGIYAFHIHAETTTGANVGSVRIYWELYRRLADSPFTETLLITSEESNILVGAETEYDMHGTLTADVVLNLTDRLVLKVYANIEVSRPTDPVVTLTAEGTTATHFEVVTTLKAFDDRYVFVTGDTMTGPLNMGSNAVSGITNLTMNGTLTIGTSTIREFGENGDLLITPPGGTLFVDGDVEAFQFRGSSFTDGTMSINEGNLSSVGTIGSDSITITANNDITLSGTGHVTSGSEGFIVGTLTITDGSIDDTDGSIAFGDTNFTGVGNATFTLQGGSPAMAEFRVDGNTNPFTTDGLGPYSRIAFLATNDGAFTSSRVISAVTFTGINDANYIGISGISPDFVSLQAASRWNGDFEVSSQGKTGTFIIHHALETIAGMDSLWKTSGDGELTAEHAGGVFSSLIQGTLDESGGTLTVNQFGGIFRFDNTQSAPTIIGTPVINYVAGEFDGTARFSYGGGGDPVATSIGGRFTAANGDINIGIEVNSVAGGTDNFAIRTGTGLVQFGDIVNFEGTMGTGSDDPTTDAPTDWVEIEIGGTQYFIPAYN